MRTTRISGMLVICGMAAASVCARQGVPFVASTIDPSNSGDCKAIADLDGDGKGDAIIAGGSLSWYEAGAAFAKHVIRASPIYDEFTTDMQAGDIDGDGDIDLIIPDSGPGNTGTIFWFENPRINPPAGHGADPRIGANWVNHTIGIQGAVVHDVEVADLDNDGRLDVVTSGHGITRIWKQVTSTTWTGKIISSLAGSGVSLGDIDGDGFKDIGTPRGWLRNPHDPIGGVWIAYPINLTTTGDECLVVDLNGDGRLDLLTCDAHDRAPMVWFENPAVATSAAWTKRTIDAAMGAHHPEAADFDRDGKMDILMGLELTELSVYINSGANPPTFAKTQLDARCAHNARAGDLDGDGFPDVLGCDYIGNPPARVYINQMITTIVCYANCDGSTASPILNANDFACFLNAYAAGSTYANCDASVMAPVLNALDFSCFLNGFAVGCS